MITQVEVSHLKQVMGQFCTGVVIVTGCHEGRPVGLTAQSFVSLSLEPPLVAISLAKTSTTWPLIRQSGAFCVNVLAEDQRDLCLLFATSGVDRFASVQWQPGPSGSPVLDPSLASVDCRIDAEHDAGDHTIVVGRVIALDSTGSGDPLLFYRGGFGSFAPG